VEREGGLNSNFFSDLALSLTIEIEEKHIASLYTRLKEAMNISTFDFDNIDRQSQKEWWIFLNITFTRGKGDLKIATRDVPG
jgi:hypothetical protein